MLASLEQADAAAFDYGTLPAETAPRQRERADRIRGMYRQTVETAGEIGRELLEAQAEMDHGLFLPWVTGAVGLSKSTAYRCMDMARSFGAKLPTVGSLPLAVVHKLSEKSTPEPVRAALLRRIEAGETIQADKILDEVREAKEAEQARVKAERETARRAALSDEAHEQEDALRPKEEKGRAARERKEAREREARREDARQREADAREGAQVLVAMLGADRAAAYFARYGGAGGCADDIAQAERARATPAVLIPAKDISRIGALYGFLDPEDRPRVETLAREIERDGLREAPAVIRREGSGPWQPYRIIEGEDTFRALTDVLGWQEIPVHIPPPVEAVTFVAPDPAPATPAGDLTAAAGAIVETSGGRTAIIVRSLREAGSHGLERFRFGPSRRDGVHAAGDG